jgi:HEAT repeat protein
MGAVYEMGRTEDPIFIPTLVEGLKSDIPDELEKISMMDILLEHAKKEPENRHLIEAIPLFSRLIEGSGRNLQVRVVKLLEEISVNNPGAEELLTSVPVLTRQEIMDIAGTAKILYFMGPKIISPLIEKLDSTDNYDRRNAIKILGRIAREMREYEEANTELQKAVLPLIELLNVQDATRSSAVEALGNFRDLRALTPLIELLDDDYSRVRANASLSIGKLAIANPGNPEVLKAIRPLIKRLKDTDEYVRSWTADSLGHIAEANPGREELKEAVNPLIEMLGDEENDYHARDALVKFRVVAIHRIIKTLENENENIRRNAILILRDMAEKPEVPEIEEAVIPLTRLLEDKNERIRQNTAWALGDIGSMKAVPTLIKALGDKSDNVIVEVAKALRDIAEKNCECQELLKAVSPLVALQDKDIFSWAPTMALKSIAEKNPGRQELIPAIAPLIKVVECGEEFKSKEASNALAAIGVSALPAVIELLNSRYVETIRTAARTIAKIADNNPRDPELEKAIPGLIKITMTKKLKPRPGWDGWNRSTEPHIIFESMQRMAIEAIGCIGAPAVDPLLKKGGENVIQAFRAIAKTHPGIPEIKKAVPFLIDYIRHPFTRTLVDIVLGEVGDIRALPVLLERTFSAGSTPLEAIRKIAKVNPGSPEIVNAVVPLIAKLSRPVERDLLFSTIGEILEGCNSRELVQDFDKNIDEALQNLRKECKDDDKLARFEIRLAELKKTATERKHELASKQDILLDGKQKPKNGNGNKSKTRIRS